MPHDPGSEVGDGVAGKARGLDGEAVYEEDDGNRDGGVGGPALAPLDAMQGQCDDGDTGGDRESGDVDVEVVDVVGDREADSFNVLPVADEAVDGACRQFGRYDDQQTSFVDHTSAVLAGAHDVDHVFTFDRADFQHLGFAVVPADTGEA